MDQMDFFQVVSELNRFLVLTNKQDDLNLMKLQLKRVLLQEILKVEVDDRDHYDERLATTLQLLEYKSKLYGCCLIGCRFEGNGHREYVKHIRTIAHKCPPIRRTSSNLLICPPSPPILHFVLQKSSKTKKKVKNMKYHYLRSCIA